ncbi:unnamed protein product [Rhizophagus irregularis]|nr:unnamed protein product [Rhizophagus irregularis]
MVELSGGYLTFDMPRYLKDHIKGFCGCRDLLNDICLRYSLGDFKIMRHLRVWFLHCHGLDAHASLQCNRKKRTYDDADLYMYYGCRLGNNKSSKWYWEMGMIISKFFCVRLCLHLYLSTTHHTHHYPSWKLFGQIKWVFNQQKSSLGGHVSMGQYSEYTDEYETYWVEFTALFNNKRKREARSPTQLYNILSIEIGLSASSFYRRQKSPRRASIDKIIERVEKEENK